MATRKKTADDGEKKPARTRRTKAAPIVEAPLPVVDAAPVADAAPLVQVAAVVDAAPTAAAPPVSQNVPSREQVADRAYAIWRARGGSSFENWLQAERELGA